MAKAWSFNNKVQNKIALLQQAVTDASDGTYQRNQVQMSRSQIQVPLTTVHEMYQNEEKKESPK